MERVWKNMIPTEVETLLGNPDYEIIDVRSVGEYQMGHIPGIKLLPLDQLEVRYAEIDSSKTVVVVCQAGARSAMACEYLVSRGFTDVINMAGGMNYWEGDVE